MSTDWDALKPDITRLYIDEDKTLQETVDSLEREYGAIITQVVRFLMEIINLQLSSVKQLKDRYGGRKKVEASEWKSIFEAIRSRKTEGKESDVYLHGKKLDRCRIERAKGRYGKSSGRSTRNPIDDRRIQIRTPAPQLVRTAPVQISIPNTPCLESADVHMAEVIASTQQNHEEQSISISEDGRYISWLDLEHLDYDYATPSLENYFRERSVVRETTDNERSASSSNPPGARSVGSASSPVVQQRLLRQQSILSQIEGTVANPLGDAQCIHYPLGQMPPFFMDSKGFCRFFPRLQSMNPVSMSWGDRRLRDRKSLSRRVFTILKLFGSTLQVSSHIVSLIVDLLIPDGPTILGKCALNSESDMDQQTLCKIFSVMAYLDCNGQDYDDMYNLRFVYFRNWLVAGGHVDTLVTFLQRYSSDVRELQSFFNKILTARFGDSDAKDPASLLSLFQKFPNETLKLLLAADKRLFLGMQGARLLEAAVGSNHLMAVKLLIDGGVNINGEYGKGFLSGGLSTPLIRAAINNQPAMIRHLVESGADINKKIDGHTSALSSAIKKKNVEVVKALFEQGATVDGELVDWLNQVNLSSEIHQLLLGQMSPEHAELSLLMKVAKKGNKFISQFLLRRGIIEDELLEKGLCYAARLGNLTAARNFLQRGVDPNTKNFGSTVQLTDFIDMFEAVDDEASDEEEASEEEVTGCTNPLRLAIRGYYNRWGSESAEEDQEIRSDQDIRRDIFYILWKAGANLDMNELATTDIVTFDLCLTLARAGYDISPISLGCLEDASSEGSIYKCDILLDMGVPIDAYCPGNNLSILQIAAREGHLELVRYLVDRGASVNLPANDDTGGTALQAAAEEGWSEIVDFLLDIEADFRAPPAKKDGTSVLEAAAYALKKSNSDYEESKQKAKQRAKNIATFKKLLAYGAPVNRPHDANGQLLHHLVAAKCMDCLELALKRGARTEDRGLNYNFMTPLQLAVARCNKEAVQLLLSYGADVNAPAAGYEGCTALQAALPEFRFSYQRIPPRFEPAVQPEILEIIQILLDRQADINASAADEFGRTLIQAATENYLCDSNFVNFLLRLGADVNGQPGRKGGITALQGAAIQGRIQIANILLDKGADVNAPAALEEGRTAIEGAAEHGHLNMVRLLLSRGAVPDPITGFERAVELAQREGHWEIADLLKECQCAFNPMTWSYGVL